MRFKINKVFSYFSCETKRKIIMHIFMCKCDNCNVEKICKSLNSKQSNISKHLMDLRKENVVKFKKTKTNIKYFMTNDFINEYIEILNFINKSECHKCNC